jgi:hypothetical protein
MSSNGQRTIVISDGTLIDGTGNAPTRNDSIVIEGNRIKSTGRLPADVRLEDRDNVEVIKDGKRVDLDDGSREEVPLAFREAVA